MVDAGAGLGRNAAVAVDLRSDTVTKPTAEMRAAMAEAELGDDVYGEDPTVNALEARAAEMFGKQAAVFFPTGTQSNLAAVLAQCGRGDEILIGRANHIFRYEAGGAAVLGSVTYDIIPTEPNGAVTPAAVDAAIKDDDSHFPRSRLLALENTHNGRVQTAAEIKAAADAAKSAGLRAHLDGARVLNACVALGVAPAEMAAPVDSVSVCLSKGLGAPAGTVLCADLETAAAARRIRKMLGGGMRQAGVVAAAGLFALDRHVERLAEDHVRAKRLATRLAALDWLDVDLDAVETNMLFATAKIDDRAALSDHLASAGVLVDAHRPTMRMVAHLDVDDDAIDAAAACFEAFEPA